MNNDFVKKDDCIESHKKFANDLERKLCIFVWINNFIANNVKIFVGGLVALICFAFWFSFQMSDWGDKNYIPREVYSSDMKAINFKLDLLLKNNSAKMIREINFVGTKNYDYPEYVEREQK